MLNLQSVDVQVEDGGGGMRSLLGGISFSVEGGEIVAVVGESGSGKTTLLRSVTHLFPPGSGTLVGGRIAFDGEDIRSFGEDQLAVLRRTSIRYVFQDPSVSFNPVSRIAVQVRTLVAGGNVENERAITTRLRAMGMDDTGDVLAAFPHQLSTGMLQRLSIAIALATAPRLILADEPTSALDATRRAAAVSLLCGEVRSRHMGLLLSTHDLTLAERFADRIIVLHSGRIVEASPAEMFFNRPVHPYSRLLLSKRHSRASSRHLPVS